MDVTEEEALVRVYDKMLQCEVLAGLSNRLVAY